jgi:DHA1 family bicyclomycin/chloramphenicol resistance-like MFS transporter
VNITHWTGRRSQDRRLLYLLGALSALPAMTIDMYLPGMPLMAKDLAASAGLVQLTVTVFVIGLAVGQVLVGPLSDSWGRRPLLVGGLVVYVGGSVLCLVSPSVEWLIAARTAQSLGAAAAAVLSRAIVRDGFEGNAMTRALTTLMLVNGIATVVAPVLGGQLLVVAPWRTVFAVLGLVGAALLLVVAMSLPESLPRQRRRPAHWRTTAYGFTTLLRDRSYLRYVSAAALMFAAMFAYISGSSFVLQDEYGISSQQYSLIFAVNAIGIVLLGQLNARLVGRVAHEHTLLGASLGLGAAAGFGVLICTIAAMPLAVLLVCLFFVVSALGPVLANATSLALAPHATSAGAAASLLGVVQYLVGGLVAFVMSTAARGSAFGMGAAIFLSAAAALLVHAGGRRASAGPCPSVSFALPVGQQP